RPAIRRWGTSRQRGTSLAATTGRTRSRRTASWSSWRMHYSAGRGKMFAGQGSPGPPKASARLLQPCCSSQRHRARYGQPEEFRAMTDKVRRLFTTTSHRLSRRHFLTASATLAGGVGASSLVDLRASSAATLKTVRFSEAVHNLGYINLYVGMHAGIFKK